jgi:RIO kinase 1
VAASQNAILMTYYGDGQMAAPTLNEISLDADEAVLLFHEVMRNVELMLRDGRIHGDLSAYNMLYWAGDVILIDFPQVVNSRVSRSTHALGNRVNPNAYDILARDVSRVCDYFAGQGVKCNPGFIMRTLWQRHAAPKPQDQAADASWLEFAEVR